MSEHESGQVAASAAVVYDEFFVPALFGRFAEPIAELGRIGATDSVVDVACGTGALTREVRARTQGEVVGVDLSAEMLSVARRRAGGVVYEEADATALPFGNGRFDLAVSQFGLMFLPDPVAGIAEMARVGRRVLVAVWSSISRSDGYSDMQELFRDEFGDDAAASLDTPFAMGEPGVLEAFAEQAGIDGVAFTEVAEHRLGRYHTTGGCVFGMGARVATWG